MFMKEVNLKNQTLTTDNNIAVIDSANDIYLVE